MKSWPRRIRWRHKNIDIERALAFVQFQTDEKADGALIQGYLAKKGCEEVCDPTYRCDTQTDEHGKITVVGSLGRTLPVQLMVGGVERKVCAWYITNGLIDPSLFKTDGSEDDEGYAQKKIIQTKL